MPVHRNHGMPKNVRVIKDTFTCRLEWRGNELWLGPVSIGQVSNLSFLKDTWETVSSFNECEEFGSESAARDALWSAAVQLLTKDET